MPNGYQNIAIVHGLGVNVQTKKSQYQFGPGAYLCGQMTSRVEVTIKELTKITLIQLHPWTLSSLLSMDGFTDQVLPINKYFLGSGIPLDHSLNPCPEKLVKTIDNHFGRVASSIPKTIVERICQYVLVNEGKCKVSDIFEDYKFSKRKLQTEFKKSIGLPIKQYVDIVRMRAAVNSVRENKRGLGGAMVAADHQYFDQSHLVKSFKKIVKITPSKFDKAKFIMPPQDL